jgi:hypothetical protein
VLFKADRAADIRAILQFWREQIHVIIAGGAGRGESPRIWRQRRFRWSSIRWKPSQPISTASPPPEMAHDSTSASPWPSACARAHRTKRASCVRAAGNAVARGMRWNKAFAAVAQCRQPSCRRTERRDVDGR